MHIGVRTDTEWLDGVLQEALADYYVPGVEAPPNFSIVLPRSEAGGPSTGLNMLYESHTNLVRSRYPDRVLRGLFQHLTKYLPVETDGMLRVSALALVRGDEAILVPRTIVTWMDLLAPRLNRAGWQFVDQPWSTIDLDAAELVVNPPTLPIDAAIFDRFDAKESSREPVAISPGRFPLVGWGVFSAEERMMSRAAGAAAAAPTILNPAEYGVHEAVQGLIALTERTPVMGLGNPLEGDFAGRLTSLAEAAS